MPLIKDHTRTYVLVKGLDGWVFRGRSGPATHGVFNPVLAERSPFRTEPGVTWSASESTSV